MNLKKVVGLVKEPQQISTASYLNPAMPAHWVKLNWSSLVLEHNGDLRIESTQLERWGLFDLISQLSSEAQMLYPVAAHWVLRQALGNRYSVARHMQFSGLPWDTDVQFICRFVALQLLRYYTPNTNYPRSISEIDSLVNTLLFPD